MRTVIIFSGTTEGRLLSDMLSRDKIRHTVCVATGYGRTVMDENPYAVVHTGRMDRDDIKDFFIGEGAEDDGIVVDATHPYAEEVTANIKSAADGLGIRYIRIKRDKGSIGTDGISVYDDMTGCAKALDTSEGNILLTTGSKELGAYFGNVSCGTGARTYVRVLPTVESLRICNENGVEADHVIAMSGPFSRELNEAVIRQYDIRHLVTKDSGTAGGFDEKLAAASGSGIKLHVIARPYEEQGVSVPEAYSIITGKEAGTALDAPEISLVGIGMGDTGCMTAEAARILSDCDAVFGAKRLLMNISCMRKFEMYSASEIIPVLEKENIKKAAVVFSGDSGFYSGAGGLQKALKEWRSGVKIKVIPGISSVSWLASRIGESYDDACLYSIHGRNTDKDLKGLIEKVRYNRKVFVLLSGTKDIPLISRMLVRYGMEGSMVIGKDLSYDHERITKLSFEEAQSYDETGIASVLIYNDDPAKRPLINIKRDDEFIRNGTPMTKETIRHESIIRLGLREGDIMYDIGGGTGSVAIEAASLHQSIEVYTIEKKHDAAGLIRQNAERSGLANINIIEGEAVSVLPGMRKPDCVFIGGSGGRLHEIMDILHAKGKGIRYVINAVSLETMEEVRKIIRKYEPEKEDAVMISVSDIRHTGSYHMLRAMDPVFIFSFTV